MNRGNSAAATPTSGISSFFARVTDIVMDANHPKWEEVGQSNGLYGIFYKEIGYNKAEDLDDDPDFARCDMSTFTLIPLLGEIVEIVTMPIAARDETSSNTNDYWKNIVNIWNHPAHNASPPTDENDFGLYYEETTEVNPLQAFPGDVIIQGRHSNTLRFGGTNFDSNIFSEDDNNGKPFAILRVGQNPDDETPHFETIVEDINLDKSSIYLTSDHTLELEQANYKTLAYIDGDQPEEAAVYRGAQVIINSDRLFFNAREESAFISAAQIIGLNSNKVAIDAEEYVGVDAPKIYLGVNSQQEEEPALLGESTVQWLTDLTKYLEDAASLLGTKSPPAIPYTAFAQGQFAALAQILKTHKTLLPPLKSRKVFLDTD